MATKLPWSLVRRAVNTIYDADCGVKQFLQNKVVHAHRSRLKLEDDATRVRLDADKKSSVKIFLMCLC